MDGFKTLQGIVEGAFKDARPIMAYCDYIAHLIQKNLKAVDTTSEKLLGSVGRIEFDLGDEGDFRSTAKTIRVEDRYGKKYIITVREDNGHN